MSQTVAGLLDTTYADRIAPRAVRHSRVVTGGPLLPKRLSCDETIMADSEIPSRSVWTTDRKRVLAAIIGKQTLALLYLIAASRSRTPGPPPFSSMNATPANSRIARSFAFVKRISLSLSSALRVVVGWRLPM